MKFGSNTQKLLMTPNIQNYGRIRNIRGKNFQNKKTKQEFFDTKIQEIISKNSSS